MTPMGVAARSVPPVYPLTLGRGIPSSGEHREGSVLNLRVLKVHESVMPKGHDWAVVTMPGPVVFILVRESVQQRNGVDYAALNEALRQAG